MGIPILVSAPEVGLGDRDRINDLVEEQNRINKRLKFTTENSPSRRTNRYETKGSRELDRSSILNIQHGYKSSQQNCFPTESSIQKIPHS